MEIKLSTGHVLNVPSTSEITDSHDIMLLKAARDILVKMRPFLKDEVGSDDPMLNEKILSGALDFSNGMQAIMNSLIKSFPHPDEKKG